MRQVIHKAFWIWEYEKEEKWLNEMSGKGLQLVDAGFCRYTFEEGTPGEFLYRIELLNNTPNHPESVSYIRFLEDTGVEHVGSYFRWVYLRKKASEGSFDLFSDIDSKIKHTRRIISMLILVMLLNIIPLLDNLGLGLLNHSEFNLVAAFISLGMTMLLLGCILNFVVRIRKYKKERMLRE